MDFTLSGIKSLFFANRTTRQTIFKNTFWLAIGNSFNKLLNFLLLVYAARILGAGDYGKFSFAFAFMSLFVVFHDFGLSTTLIREYSKKEDQKDREDLYSVLSLKILLGIVAFFVILASSFFISADPQIRRIILILSVFSIFNSMSTVFYSIFQARQKMEYQTLSEGLQYLCISGLGFFALFFFPSIENLSYGYLAASLISLVFTLVFFSVKIFKLRISLNISVWKKFLKMSWPLALTSLFGFLYSYIDSVMMGKLGMIVETGWYNAAYRIAAFALIPMGFISGSFYPVLSNFFKESKEKLQKVWDYEILLMILFAFPIAVGGIALAPKIIYFFYPNDFYPSITAFKMLIITTSLILIYRPLLDVMIASNQQKSTFWITFFGALANIMLNLFLIPKYRLYGAAFSTVITYILVLCMSVWFTKKLTPVKISLKKIFYFLFLTSVPSALMYFVVIQPVVYNLNVFFSIIIGAFIYAVSIFALGKTTKFIYEKI